MKYLFIICIAVITFITLVPINANAQTIAVDSNPDIGRWQGLSEGTTGEGEPCGVAVDGGGHVYVSDCQNDRVQVWGGR